MCRDAYGFVTPRPRTVVGPWGHRIADEVDHKKRRTPYVSHIRNANHAAVTFGWTLFLLLPILELLD